MHTIYPERGRPCTPDSILKHLGAAHSALNIRKPLDLGDGLVLNCGLRGRCRRLIIKYNQNGSYDIEFGKSHDLRYTVIGQERNVPPGHLSEELIRLTEGKLT